MVGYQLIHNHTMSKFAYFNYKANLIIEEKINTMIHLYKLESNHIGQFLV